jgi:hypothetical protein
MYMIGYAGPPTPSKIQIYHTQAVAPAFLAIFTIGSSAIVYDKTACHTKYLPCIQFHIIERSRFPPRRSMDRAGALPVGSYALPKVSRCAVSIIGSIMACVVTATLLF